MRVVLSTWGSRGDVEPLAGLAAKVRELGAEVRVCAPPEEEFVALLDRAGVRLTPLGPTVRSVVTRAEAAEMRSSSRPSWSPPGTRRSPWRRRVVTCCWRPA